jgi:3-phenylpropionate/cinnamic acid dioxygenase small subunit
MTDERLVARVTRLEARAEIVELLMRYTLHIDDQDFEALGELFVSDARFGAPGRQHVGRDAIIANYRRAGELYPITLHEARGCLIVFQDDAHATGRVTGFSEQANDVHSVIASFRYHDEYVREKDSWRFAAREVHTLYAMTHAEHAAGGLSGALRSRWPHRTPEPAELPVHQHHQ